MGWQVLAFGWLPPFTILWSANLWLMAGCVYLLLGQTQTASRYGLCAAVFSLPAILLIPHARSGFYCWLACIIGLVAATQWLYKRNPVPCHTSALARVLRIRARALRISHPPANPS